MGIFGKRNYPVFNILLQLDSRGEIHKKFDYERMDNIGKYIGIFNALDSGKLVRGIKYGLHTFEGEISREEIGPRASITHAHLKPHMRIEEIHVMGNSAYVKNRSGLGPLYTIKGLYREKYPKTDKEKIELIAEELEEKTFFDSKKSLDNSIAKYDKTKLKILENQYKRRISNQ